MALRQTFSLIGSRFGPLLGLTLLLYGPYFVAYGLVVSFGLLPEQGADMLFGLLSLMISPFSNGGIVHVVHQANHGLKVSMLDGLKVGLRVWPRLVAAYISVSFVWIGYLVVTVLPGALIMFVLDIKTPFALIPFGVVGTLFALPPYAFLDSLIVVEGLLPYQARQTSWKMTKGRRLRIVLLGLVALALPTGLELLGETGIPILGDAGVSVAVIGVLSSLLYVPPIVLAYVLYSEAANPANRYAGAAAT